MDKRCKELECLIEKQKEELSRYKKRLADLVTAYKCLSKEKEVLEASLKALNQVSSNASDQTLDDSSTRSSEESNENEECDQLKQQLNTLMNSLATLSEEKSRMEAGFQADKKQLRCEKQQLETTIKDLQERLEHETRAHLTEMETFKSKLIIERHQREKEHNDHGVMIRELQKVVSEERGRREKVESELDGLKSRLLEADDQLNAAEKGWSETKTKLEETLQQLDQARKGTGDVAVKLQNQLAALKLELTTATSKERARAVEAEERAKSLAEFHEERVANLEARLAELSETVGTYDRLRQADQISIDKLKERLIQLELEHGEEKGDLSVDNLVSRLKTVKELLELANLASEKPVDVKEIISEIFQICKENDSHDSCRVEYNQLKKEFEIYKQKNMMSSNSFRMEPDNEVESLKNQIRGLKEKIRTLHDHMEQQLVSYKKDLEQLRQSGTSERRKYREKLETSEKKWKEEVDMLELQLAKQRERALGLVKEKEQEINELKQSFSHLLPHRLSQASQDKDDLGGGMLHFNQEVARRDVELCRLRRDNYSLESELRQLSLRLDEAFHKEHQLQSALRQQTDRLNRYQSQDGANLEYLKNVVFSFLMTGDTSSKGHMLNAIATVLRFTDSERNSIKQQSWWYNKVTLS